MGDFLGFTFGGVHSSELGITRVSGGDRYDEDLHPEIKDRTAEVPGLDGEYYFGTNYGSKKFVIDFAFDSITETQFRKIRKIFNTKDVKELIFDERPYKKYLAKIGSPIELSFVCFDEPKKHIDNSGTAQGIRWVEQSSEVDVIDASTNEPTGEVTTITERVRETIYPFVRDEGTERIYKGEGKISLVSYFPFAKSVYKQLPVEDEESDWAVSSGILSAADYAGFDTYNITTGIINIYNAGDISTGFRLYCPFSAATSLKLTYKPDGINSIAQLNIDTMIPQLNHTNTTDVGVIINTDNGLIQGVQSFGYDESGNAIYTTSGNIYNRYVDSGYFFRLEPNISILDGTTITITDKDNNIINNNGIKIFYDYLYF